MQNFKLTLEYDGTEYHGFQIQPNGNTIQAEIEKAIEKLFHQKIRIISCGRTDAGVHALNHVINFKVKTKIALTNIQKALNGFLPDDILVLKVQKVADRFHAQYSAKKKTYVYYLNCSELKNPLKRRYQAFQRGSLNTDGMREAISCLKGEHDFRSFASKTDLKKDTVRTLFKAELSQKGQLITFRFEGSGFLYNMVRNLVGSLIHVGQGKMTPQEFEHLLILRDRKKAGPVAPPEGLHLIQVKY